MFTSALATKKQLLLESIHGLIRGYCLMRYDKTDLSQIFLDESLADDQFLYHLGEQAMTVDVGNCTVIDFKHDFTQITGELRKKGRVKQFTEVCKEEFMHGEDMHLPFPDYILTVGPVVLQESEEFRNDYPPLNDVIVRVMDVTDAWNKPDGDRVNLHRGRQHADDDPRQKEKYKRVVEVCMYALQNEYKNLSLTMPENLVPTTRPLTLFITEDGDRFHQQAEFYDDFVEEFMYPKQPKESIKEWENVFTSLALFAVGAFSFLYKNQRVDYEEVEPPQGLQKKRRKRNLKPYERYCVSTLGNFTKKVYKGEPREQEEDSEHGVALHIRRGHWKLNYGHSRLPVEQQKKHWQAAMVVGDPKYGIIIRDYEAHLLDEVG